MLDLVIRLSILLAIFASVFLFSQLVLGAVWRNREKVAAVNKRLRMIREGSGRAEIAARLRKNFIRDPYVAAEIETYRPFFILGEVTAPGQYPYVPNMTAESAVAIAGGFSPRAKRDFVTITHPAPGGTMRAVVSPDTPINPGDTVIVRERWF